MCFQLTAGEVVAATVTGSSNGGRSGPDGHSYPTQAHLNAMISALELLRYPWRPRCNGTALAFFLKQWQASRVTEAGNNGLA